MRNIIFLLGLGVSSLIASGALAREWSDLSGKFKVEAEFVAVKEGKVVLEKPDGTYVSVPLDKLSKADQDFVAAKTKEKSDNPFEEIPDPKKAGASSGAGPQVVALRSKSGDKPGEIRRFPEQGWGIKSLAFSPDGAMLAAGKPDRALALFDVVEEGRLHFEDKLETLQSVSACRFTPDGKKLLAAGYTGLILIWDVTKEGRLKSAGQFAGHSQEIHCLATSADGTLAISGGQEKRVRYWSVESGKELGVFEGFQGNIKALLISPDGRAAYATDGSVLLAINLEKKEIVKRAKLNSSWAAGQFATFSPSGSHVAAGDGYKVRVWEMKSGKELPTLEDREIQWSGEFTPDGNRLVTGASGKINVWDIKKSSRISTLATAGTSYVQCLAVSPDNLHVAAIPGSAGQDLTVIRIPGVNE